MWIIKNLHSDECYYLLREKESYSVGRAGTDLDIVLRDDTSISRTHAVLHLSKTGNKMLELEDLGSKFGTYHNELRISKGDKVNLHEGDRIRFGLLKNVWNVSYWPLVSMSSALPEEQVPQFEQYLNALDGKVLQQWDASCTHLTMAEVTITVKLLQALLEQIPIVACNYWRDLLHAVNQRKVPLPSPEAYLPRCCETIIHSDAVNLGSLPERKSIFVGLTFVFINRKHYDMYAPIVQKAGAKCKDLNSDGGVPKSFLVMSGVVVIQYIPSTQSQSSHTINSIENYLESNSRRIVPEYEIGLAIMHCSAAKYCNPCYKIINDLMPSSMPCTASTSSQSYLALNTHVNSCGQGSQLSEIHIPETQANSHIRREVSEAIMGVAEVGIGQESANMERDRMPTVCVTESVSDQREVKRKCPVVAADDENFLEFAETPHKKFKTTLKTLSQVDSFEPVLKNKGRKSTIDVSGFLEKPHGSKTHENFANISNKNNAATEEIAQRKRPHIAIITEDDDDDLFNFGNDSFSSAAVKKSRPSVDNDQNDSDEDLFSFTTQAKHCVDKDGKSASLNDDDLAPTEQFVPKVKKKCLQNQLPKPKPLPKKVSTEGWLSCSLEKVKLDPDIVKAELTSSPTMKKEEGNEDESITHKKWVDTLKSGCQVNIRSFDLTTHSKEFLRHQSDLSGNDDSVDASVGKCTNFKKFIKKYHRHSENRSTC